MRFMKTALVVVVAMLLMTGCDQLLDQTKDTAPSAPRQLNIQLNQNGTIEMSWIDEADNEDGFRLECQESGSIVWTPIADLARNTTSYGWTSSIVAPFPLQVRQI